VLSRYTTAPEPATSIKFGMPEGNDHDVQLEQ
jgi:hypothetical protein